ncbi:hypothetical protein WJX72_000845 [[Myrmecia] bisecta]|uniref:Uncharacterized protein n=1 Tax=[Myrmecia] bisecta TaxID=41462 RepID=A0AAW1QE29_9CHLO
MPAGHEAAPAALARILEFARLVRKLQCATAALQDAEQRAIWQQRGTWLHEELMALTAERLQAGDPADFWSNVVALVYLSVDSSEAVNSEKAELAEALRKEQAHAAALQERLASHQQASTSQKSEAASSAEMLELRTKLVVAQQEVQRRAGDSRDMLQRLQAALAERDNWKKQHAALQEEKARQQADFDRQAKVIAQLLARSNEATSDAQKVLAATADLRKHNHTLSVNLENHARVVEKLISLNTELMDVANARSFGHLKAGQPDGVHNMLANGSSLPGPLPVSTSAWQPKSGFDQLVNGHAPGGAPAASLESQLSLGAAFDAFLRADDEPQPAGRLDLELPGPEYHNPRDAQQQQAPHSAGGGLTGMLSKAANLAMYVAGSDKAIQQRARDLGEPDLV